MPGGALGCHPNLSRGAVGVDHKWGACAKVDGDDVVLQFRLEIIVLQRVQRIDERRQFFLGESNVFVFGEHAWAIALPLPPTKGERCRRVISLAGAELVWGLAVVYAFSSVAFAAYVAG